MSICSWFKPHSILWRLFGCHGEKPGPPPPPPPPPKIKVVVCVTSGLLPNPYCPQTVEREYVKGTEPTQGCSEHHAPPPIETTQDILRERGYLVGASCYQLSAQELPVIEAYFKGLQAAGATLTEAFLI